MYTTTRRRGVIGAVVTALTAIGSFAVPASAHAGGQPAEETPIGFFYSTFEEGSNLWLLAGGTAEEFCRDNPDDPFNGTPGSVLTRVKERHDGTIVIRGKGHGVPIHLYEQDGFPTPDWIVGLCADLFDDDPTTVVPEPLASGYGTVRIRDVIDGNRVDVYNSVRGTAYGADGTRYRIRASADFEVVDGELIGNPPDFVELDVRQRRCR